MQTEQLNIKVQPELFKEIDLVSRILHIPKNEWARNILAYEVKKELEEHKTFLVREYFKCNITRKELAQILGENEVRDLERIARIGRQSFEEAAKLAKAMK